MKPKLIYISPWNSTFVKKDISFLSKKYAVLSPNLQWNSKSLLPILFLKQLIWLFLNLPKSEHIIIMFGGYHSFIPAVFGKIFKKKTFIILGGTECVSLPPYNYGSLRKPIMKWFIKHSFQFADYLLPVDQSLVSSNNLYINSLNYSNQGFRHYFKNLQTSFKIIHNGFANTEINVVDKIPNTVITVADINDTTRFYLKGIDKIIMLANTFPSVKFKIVGISKSMQEFKELPKNIEAFDFLPYKDFEHHLQTSQFYTQLSISEGFPNALCEAMMQQCIPIGSAVGGIPEIIDDTGFLVDSIENKSIIEAFEKAFAISNDLKKKLGNSARKRIIENYPLEKREQAFLKILSKN